MNHTSSRFRMLLLELVCDLCIFMLCAAVCVALIVQSRAMSRQSGQLTHAVYLAQSAAESFKTGAPPPAAPEGFTVTLTPAGDGGTSTRGYAICDITVTCDGSEIYTLEGVTAK